MLMAFATMAPLWREMLGVFSGVELKAAENPNWRYDLLHPVLLEVYFWIIVGLFTAVLYRWRPHFLDRIEQQFKAFAQHRWRSVIVVALAAFALRAALLPLVPIPDPVIHDEFSYILGAKTLAEGRLTTPTHPMWVHFETFHVNMVPTYQSMYPPAQAMTLAMGERFLGNAWYGEWLSIVVMCAAICWMLQAWLPPHWALLGGMFCVVRFAAFSYWTNSYWGGAVAAIGGALLFGSLPRLRASGALVYGLLIGVALLLLANSRPYEGVLVSVPAAIWILWWLFKQRPSVSSVARWAIPLAVVLAAGLSFMGYYNWRGTGHAFEMPYQANFKQYHLTRMFLWQDRLPVPHYRHSSMRRNYVFWEMPPYLASRNGGLWSLIAQKLRGYYEFYLWPLLLLLLFFGRRMLADPAVRVIGWTLLVVLCGLCVISWPPQSHYAAPALPLLLAAMLFATRTLRQSRAWGVAASRAMTCVLLAWIALVTALTASNPYYLDRPGLVPQIERARLVNELNRTAGQHLVIVHTPDNFSPGHDWVYNEPDIDKSHVVWARDMGSAANRELVDYFRDRHVWYVDPSWAIVKLQRYEPVPNSVLAFQTLRH